MLIYRSTTKLSMHYALFAAIPDRIDRRAQRLIEPLSIGLLLLAGLVDLFLYGWRSCGYEKISSSHSCL